MEIYNHHHHHERFIALWWKGWHPIFFNIFIRSLVSAKCSHICLLWMPARIIHWGHPGYTGDPWITGRFFCQQNVFARKIFFETEYLFQLDIFATQFVCQKNINLLWHSPIQGNQNLFWITGAQCTHFPLLACRTPSLPFLNHLEIIFHNFFLLQNLKSQFLTKSWMIWMDWLAEVFY